MLNFYIIRNMINRYVFRVSIYFFSNIIFLHFIKIISFWFLDLKYEPSTFFEIIISSYFKWFYHEQLVNFMKETVFKYFYELIGCERE